MRVPIFNTIFVETGAACNRHCVFCPNHKNVRPDDYMSEQMFKSIVDELVTLNWRGRFSPFIYNEPMRDTRQLFLCEYVCARLPGAWFMVSTNGDYFKSRTDVQDLLDAGCRSLQINVYSEWDGDTARRDKAINIAEARYRTLVDMTKGMGQGTAVYRKPHKGEIHLSVERKFGTRSDDQKLGSTFELQNRSGNIDWLQPAITEPLAKPCTRPWRTLNINWTGEALLCCNDYHGLVPLGNVKNKSLTEIWNGEGFNKYRLFLQNKRRDLPLCDKCDFGGGAYTHLLTKVSFGKKRDKELLNEARTP